MRAIAALLFERGLPGKLLIGGSGGAGGTAAAPLAASEDAADPAEDAAVSSGFPRLAGERRTPASTAGAAATRASFPLDPFAFVATFAAEVRFGAAFFATTFFAGVRCAERATAVLAFALVLAVAPEERVFAAETATFFFETRAAGFAVLRDPALADFVADLPAGLLAAFFAAFPGALFAGLADAFRTGFVAGLFADFLAICLAAFFGDFFAALETLAFARATRCLLDPALFPRTSTLLTTSRDDSGFQH